MIYIYIYMIYIYIIYIYTYYIYILYYIYYIYMYLKRRPEIHPYLPSNHDFIMCYPHICPPTGDGCEIL